METVKAACTFPGRSAVLPAILAVCASLAPQTALAEASTYQVEGKINDSCTAGQAAPFVLTTNIGSNGKLDPNLDKTTWTSAGWLCNAPSRITLSARALRRNAPLTSLNPSQTQTINFTASASGWTSSDAVVTTGETTALGSGTLYTGAGQLQNAPRRGTIVIRVGNFAIVSTTGNSKNPAKPVNGAYSATITITLAPNS